MSKQAIKEYIEAIVDRYWNASKQEKTKILDEAEKVTKRDRKRLIRRLKEQRKPRSAAKSKAGAPKEYLPGG